jgi:hypothetical protein
VTAASPRSSPAGPIGFAARLGSSAAWRARGLMTIPYRRIIMIMHVIGRVTNKIQSYLSYQENMEMNRVDSLGKLEKS